MVTGDYGYAYPWTASKEWLLNVKFSQQEAFKNTKDADLKVSRSSHFLNSVDFVVLAFSDESDNRHWADQILEATA